MISYKPPWCRQALAFDRTVRDVILLDPAIVLPENDYYRWTTLSQLRELVKIPGILSIEMRCAMSILLAYI